MMKSISCTVLAALLAWGTACSSSGDEHDPESDSGGSGGSDGSDSDGSDDTSGASSSADCEGAFTTIDAPYAPNTAIEDWGGFAADEQGLVFTALPDTAQASYDADLPSLMIGSDLEGNVKTLYTYDDGSIPGPIFTVGDEIYFVEGLLSRSIMKLPRDGGDAELVRDDDVRAGPVSDGAKLYYSSRPTSDSKIVAFDIESGEVEELADRGNVEVFAIAVDGDQLYFVERESVLSEGDSTLYSMPVSGGDPELVMQLPHETALGSFRVVDEVGFGSQITESFGIEINRIEFGEAPSVVEDQGGMPMLIGGDKIYYNAYEGLVENSLEFDAPRVITDAAGLGIYALAINDSSLWYAVQRCIYQAPR